MENGTLAKFSVSRDPPPWCVRGRGDGERSPGLKLDYKTLLHWLREAEPDIVCLQELKAADTEFPADAIRQAGYHAVWRGEKRWNGEIGRAHV